MKKIFQSVYKKPKINSLFIEWDLTEKGLLIENCNIECSSVFSPKSQLIPFDRIYGVSLSKYVSGPSIYIKVDPKFKNSPIKFDFDKLKTKLENKKKNQIKREETKAEEEIEEAEEGAEEKREILFVNPKQTLLLGEQIKDYPSINLLDPSVDVWREILMPEIERHTKPDYDLLEQEFGISKKEVSTLQLEYGEVLKSYNISNHAGLFSWDHYWGMRDFILAQNALIDENTIFAEFYWKFMDVATRKIPPIYDPSKPRTGSLEFALKTILTRKKK